MNVEFPWTVYRTRFLVSARQLTETLVFTDALGRQHFGQAGDYLVEYSEGLRTITPRTAFEDIYVPLESQPRSAGALPSSRNAAVVGSAVASPAVQGAPRPLSA